MTKLALLSASFMLMLAACSEQSSTTNLPPGQYERNTESTDANGTTVKRNTETNVTVDEYGRKRAVITKKTTRDPRGLLNKSTSESREVIQER